MHDMEVPRYIHHELQTLTIAKLLNLSLDKSLTIKSKPKFSWLTYDSWHHCLFLSKNFPEKI